MPARSVSATTVMIPLLSLPATKIDPSASFVNLAPLLDRSEVGMSGSHRPANW